MLLARRGEEVFALGAHCTHYGAPLAEGLLAGETLRCPWHHACFAVRTGEAVGAPALNDLPRYAVVREGDRVRVGEKLPPPPRPRRPGGPASIVIAGAGGAGNAAAEMLRREGYGGRIVLVGREEDVPYDRPNLSKDYLAGTAPEEWIPLRPREFYAEQEIELRLGREIAALDVAGRRLQLAGGEAARLRRAAPRPRRRAGAPATSRAPSALALPALARRLRAIIARAEAARRAVVLGASFIGLEVAASLRARGLEVVVVAPDERPLERVLGPELGDFVRGLHEEKGVRFRLGQTAAAIGEADVTLQSGERLPADLVVAGIGVRPAVALAERAGLRVDNGVVVDAFLETSAPGIFAAGDLARYPDPRSGESLRVEHWVVAERQGQAAARNILGRRRPFDRRALLLEPALRRHDLLRRPRREVGPHRPRGLARGAQRDGGLPRSAARCGPWPPCSATRTACARSWRWSAATARRSRRCSARARRKRRPGWRPSARPAAPCSRRSSTRPACTASRSGARGG